MYGSLVGWTSDKENGLTFIIFRIRSLAQSLGHGLYSIKVGRGKEER